MSNEQTPAEIAAEARAEKTAFAIIGVIVAAMVIGFFTLGVAGVGIVAVALVPIIYVMLVLMAGGKG